MVCSKRWFVAFALVTAFVPAVCSAQGRLSLPGRQRLPGRPAASHMQAALDSGNKPDPLFVALIHTIERGLSGQKGGRSPFDDAFNATRTRANLDARLLQQLVSEFRSTVAGRNFASVPVSMTGLRADVPLDSGRFSSEFSRGNTSSGGGAVATIPSGAMVLAKVALMEGLFDPQIITIGPEAPMGYKRGQTLDVSGRNFVLDGWNTVVSVTRYGGGPVINIPGIPTPKPQEKVIRQSELIGFSTSGFKWKIPSNYETGKYLLVVRLTKNQRSASGQAPEIKSDSALVYVETPPPGQPIVQTVGVASVGKYWSIDVVRLGDTGDAQNVLMKPLDGQKLWDAWDSPTGTKVSVLTAKKSLYAKNQIVAAIPWYFPPGRYEMAVNSKSYGHSPWQQVFVQPLKASVRLSSLKCLTEWPEKSKDDYVVTIAVVSSGRSVQVSVLDPLGPFGDGAVKPYPDPASALFQKGGGAGGLSGKLYVGLCIARWPKGVPTFAQRGLQPIADLAGQMASKNKSITDQSLAWEVSESVAKLVVWAGGDALLSQTHVSDFRPEDMFASKSGAGEWQPSMTRKLAARPGLPPCLYEIAYEVTK